MTSQRNVLVDSNAVACISYYGLDLVLRGEPSSKSTASVRWMAPEILLTENRRVTSVDEGKRADVYSFAMVTFEVSLPKPTPHFEYLIPLATGLVRHHSVPRREPRRNRGESG